MYNYRMRTYVPVLFGILIFLPQLAFAGSQTFTSSGTFLVPVYGTLPVIVDGGGGGGGGLGYSAVGGQPGGNGGSSQFAGVISGGGGGGGRAPWSDQYGAGGAGGSASGGDINTSGNAGSSGGSGYGGHGGASAGGALGGSGASGCYGCGGSPGSSGGGGGGGGGSYPYQNGGGGGGGARSQKTYASGLLTVGSAIAVTVGAGGYSGAGGSIGGPGGAGASGQISISWTDPLLQCNGTPEVYSTPGAYTRTVPTYSSMSVTVSGAGGGGASGFGWQMRGGGNCQDSTAGGDGSLSQFGPSVIAYGGQGGRPNGSGTPSTGASGTPGGAAGGDIDTTGAGATGGVGGYWATYACRGGNGGTGGKSTKTYSQGQLTPGAGISITVGGGGGGATYPSGQSGGNGQNGSSGSNGSVTITCSQLSPPTTPTWTNPVVWNSSAVAGTSYTYGFTGTTPNNPHLIRYAVDWDNDGSIDEYIPATGYTASGSEGDTTHATSSPGTMTFRVQTIDTIDGAHDADYSAWATFSKTVVNPAPMVLLTASPSSVTANQSSTLTWSSSNATSCTGTNFSTGGAVSGWRTVSPTVTTTYSISCTGPGGTGSDVKTVTFTCTPTNICSGNTVVNSCTGATVQSCSYQCGAGACITPPPPSFNAGSGTTGHLQVKPQIVPRSGTTTVLWNVSNVSACSVTGSNGQTWNAISGSSTTLPITQQTTFTLACTPYSGQSFTPETQAVNVTPTFQER